MRFLTRHLFRIRTHKVRERQHATVRTRVRITREGPDAEPHTIDQSVHVEHAEAVHVDWMRFSDRRMACQCEDCAQHRTGDAVTSGSGGQCSRVDCEFGERRRDVLRAEQVRCQ